MHEIFLNQYYLPFSGLVELDAELKDLLNHEFGNITSELMNQLMPVGSIVAWSGESISKSSVPKVS